MPFKDVVSAQRSVEGSFGPTNQKLTSSEGTVASFQFQTSLGFFYPLEGPFVGDPDERLKHRNSYVC